MSQTAGFKQDLYDLAYTRHMQIYPIDNLCSLYRPYGCYGPEIRQEIHVYTASMTISYLG